MTRNVFKDGKSIEVELSEKEQDERILEIEAEQAKKDSDRKLTHYSSADDYFNKQVDNRFFTLLNRADLLSKNGVKFQEVNEWIESFWSDYFSRKNQDGNFDFDYSNNGNVPHSYSEVKAEFET